MIKEGVPNGFAAQTWGQMIFHRTFHQAQHSELEQKDSLSNRHFPLEGSLTPPVAALDREAAYCALCVDQCAAGKELANTGVTTWAQRCFDFAGHPTIFDRRTLKSLNALLKE